MPNTQMPIYVPLPILMQCHAFQNGHSIREAAFTHSQGDDQPFVRPVKSYSAAKLGGHTSVHQFAP